MRTKGKTILVNAVILITILAVYFLSSSRLVNEGLNRLMGRPKRFGSTAAILVHVDSLQGVSALSRALSENGLKATFFFREDTCCDDNVLKRVSIDGHEIAIAGEANDESVLQQIERCTGAFKKAGVDWSKLFMPIDGYSNEGINCANQMGFELVLWSVDSLDGSAQRPDDIIETVKRNMTPETYLLITPQQHTIEAVEQIARLLEEQSIKTSVVGKTY